MMHVFAGWDQREAIGFHVFAHSMIRRASMPVSIIPLGSLGAPEGTNAFTLSRFLIPYLMGFQGHAIFVDASDMLCLADIVQLERCYDRTKAVQVVKHPDYQSSAERKYIGTEMESAQSNYPRKNWASVMLINCAHSAWYGMTPKAVDMSEKIDLLGFAWLKDCEIGEIEPEWNVLVDEGQDTEGANILHWTQGIPAFPHYRNARCSRTWFDERNLMVNLDG